MHSTTLKQVVPALGQDPTGKPDHFVWIKRDELVALIPTNLLFLVLLEFLLSFAGWLAAATVKLGFDGATVLL